MDTIEKDKLVTISVKLYDLQGHLLEETPEGGYSYLHGHADIFPKIEAMLEGKKTGDRVVVTLEPEDAFGDFDENAIYLVDVEKLGGAETIVPGLVFDHVPGEADDGRRYRVTDVAEGKALLDANHPYAGWTLKFDVTVLSVESTDGREATGNDETVVPSFLGLADRIVDEGDEDDTDYSAADHALHGGRIEFERN